MTTNECSVLRCSSAGERSWSTGETEAEFADWRVCRKHHELLRSGVDFATQGDIAISVKRWLVMGDDLVAPETDDLRSVVVGFEFTGSGKEMEVELTTGKETFDVILDKEQAAEMGQAIATMSEQLPVPPSVKG